MQKLELLKIWLNFKHIVLFLLIPTLKVLTKLFYTYFKEILKLCRKNGAITKGKMFEETFFNRANAGAFDFTWRGEF